MNQPNTVIDNMRRSNATEAVCAGKGGTEVQPPDFHLSVVATSRNDNHGGSLTRRMQHFVDGFVAQCVRHNLSAELILVEWNPPADRPPLSEALRWPEHTGPCEIRIVTVPREMHAQLAHSEKLPLFQMIAKNVGIRRARGRYVLATNIDILFPDACVVYMRDRLRSGRLYRTVRYDVPAELPQDVPLGDLLSFCWREIFRQHANGNTFVRDGAQWSLVTLIKARLDPRLRYLFFVAPKNAWEWVSRSSLRVLREFRRPRSTPEIWLKLQRRVSSPRHYVKAGVAIWELCKERIVDPWLFTNACGDFTLLSRDDWFLLRAYPEWPIYSFHIDSVLLHQAYRCDIREIDMGRRSGVFHIDHDAGSGFTPEASDQLFARLEAKGIPCLDWTNDVVPMLKDMDEMRRHGQSWQFNNDDWGFGGRTLKEQIIRRASSGRHRAAADDSQASTAADAGGGRTAAAPLK